MSYIKAVEEAKWNKWKSEEEKKLRELGVNEEIIEALHKSDWDDFNRDRRYAQRKINAETILNTQIYLEQEGVVINVQCLLDSIENEHLLNVLIQSDKTILKILLLKIAGYSTHEISKSMGISEKSIYCKISRLKKKLKNIF